MKHAFAIAIRLMWAGFLILSSAYCLLAYLPYTFHAFIKAPVYAWMPSFATYHVWLYWVLLVAHVAGLAWERASRSRWIGAIVLFAIGVFLAVKPVLSQVRNDASSYIYSLAALLLLIFLLLIEADRSWWLPEESPKFPSVQYAEAAAVAIALAIFYGIGVQIRMKIGGNPFVPSRWAMLMAWSTIAHVTIALMLAVGMNLLNGVSAQLRRPRNIRFGILCMIGFACLWSLLANFASSALSLSGWTGWLYTALLSLSFTVTVASVTLTWSARSRDSATRWRVMTPLLFVAAAVVALSAPALIGSNDWNGVIQRSVAMTLWIVAAICVYRLKSSNREQSIAKAVVIALVVVLVFSSLKFAELAWAKPLGNTDDEIDRSVDAYAELDASFNTAHSLLSTRKSEPCDELCRILRQYTNIRQSPDVAGFDLVKDLKPTTGEHPNIFIWVVDSLRPDYLGAYNPKANFTPNLDAFARQSIVLHNAYTQYAGTTISEPAVWSGAELLHTHYVHPFKNVNSLEKLARVDGYQLMVSRDTVLDELFANDSDIIDVEEQKARWNSIEMCSTTRALGRKLDARSDKTQPVMFLSQPMNVHQFAINDLPKARDHREWAVPGFETSASFKVHQLDGCFGQFVSALKQREMFDNSIIVVTADHGDATGELGRLSHSVVLYPEVMRVPLLVHLPRSMQGKFVQDEQAIKTVTDIAPTLYYLLGHKQIEHNPLFGRPVLAESQAKLDEYARRDWFLASDAIAAYGYLADGGRYFYATYDSPARSYLYDLNSDPKGIENVLTPELKRDYDRRIIEHLKAVSEFYGHKPGMDSFFSNKH